MARLLYIVPRFHTNLFFATRALHEAGHHVTVCAADDAWNEDYSFVTPLVLGREPSWSDVRATLDDVRPDLTFIRSSHNLSIRMGWILRLRRRRAYMYSLAPVTRRAGTGRKIQTFLRGMPQRRVSPVPGLSATSPAASGAHFLPFPAEPYDQADLSFRRDDDPITRILCVGKLRQPRKNQHMLIDALAPSADKVHLTLVGSDEGAVSGADADHLARLRDAADRHDWITLKSNVDFGDMAGLYAAHHLCVLPAFKEPLGVAPLEAMAYGCIPAISIEAGSAGYIDHGHNGLRLDVRRNNLRDVLDPVLADHGFRSSLSRASRNYAETELTGKRYVERVERLLTG